MMAASGTAACVTAEGSSTVLLQVQLTAGNWAGTRVCSINRQTMPAAGSAATEAAQRLLPAEQHQARIHFACCWAELTHPCEM